MAASTPQPTVAQSVPQTATNAHGAPASHTVLPPGRPASPPLPFPATAEPAPGFDATLPAQLTDKTSLIDVDIDALPDKPWTLPGAHLADYFNYGFEPTTWKLYTSRQKQLRDESQQDAENPFRAFAELPVAEAWNSLSPEHKGQMMQTIVGGNPMGPMMMMGMGGMPPMPPMGMPGMPGPPPPQMPGQQDFDGPPRGIKRLRGEDGNAANDSADESSSFGGGGNNNNQMPDMPMPTPEQQQQMMMAMQQQSGMDPSQMMDPAQMMGMMPPGAANGMPGFNGAAARGGGGPPGRGGRGRGGRGNNPFGIGINPSARGRAVSRGDGTPGSPTHSDSGGGGGAGGGASPLPTNVPTGPKQPSVKPPSGPRTSSSKSGSRLHRDKDRDSSSRGGYGELDYGDNGRSSRERSSRSRRYDEEEDDYGGSSSRRRRSSRSPPRRGRSRSPVYDDYDA